MTLQTQHYHFLTCNGRVDNIVDSTCGAKSPGEWRDAELMEEKAIKLGWTKVARGHLCPSCSAAESTEKAAPAKSRAKAKPVESTPVQSDSDQWIGGQ